MTKDIKITLDQNNLVSTKSSLTNTIRVDPGQQQTNLVVVGDSYSSGDVKATKDQGNPISSRVGSENTLKVVTGVSVGGTITSIYDLEGLDISGSEDGNILIFNGDSNLWESVDEIDGGVY